jgi:hypothetical protein
MFWQPIKQIQEIEVNVNYVPLSFGYMAYIEFKTYQVQSTKRRNMMPPLVINEGTTMQNPHLGL